MAILSETAGETGLPKEVIARLKPQPRPVDTEHGLSSGAKLILSKRPDNVNPVFPSTLKQHK